MTINGSDTISISPIGVIRSCFPEKFGIPRQAGLVHEAAAQIILFSPFDRAEMVKGLEQFSHLWVHFHFHETLEEGWKSTVRPPGLGGQERVGVFASRSPHRPNHLGFSAVKLEEIQSANGKTVLQVMGGDFLDGTPVIDIKPYVPFCDVLEGASSGYSGRISSGLEVEFSDEAQIFCRNYQRQTGRTLHSLISQVLHQDPRPASQRRKKKNFGIQLWDVNVRWRVEGEIFTVTSCSRV